MSITKTQWVAGAIIALSLLLGTGGTIWSIFGAFSGFGSGGNRWWAIRSALLLFSLP